jgi:hypothetical protein
MTDFDEYDLLDIDYENEETINYIRSQIWLTASGRELEIGSMSDTHLLNAYKKTADERLFKEMVVRLFEKHHRGE